MQTKPTKLQSQKITVSLPEELVNRMNEIIPTRQRSRFIAEALEERLALVEQAIAIEEGAGIWKDEDYPHLATDDDIEQWIRELRSGRNVSKVVEHA
jgi:predicted transcriptional regulator